MQAKKQRKTILILIFIMIIIAGCKTVEFTPESETIEKKVGDIQFELRYVSEAETVELLGKDYNPYYGYPGKLPRKQFFIFETSITSESSEAEIKLRDITISLDESSPSKARSQTTLDLDWKAYYKTDSERARKKSNMKKTMSGDTITITPDQPFQGWIVFLPSVSTALLQNILIAPKDGPSNAVIHIPAKTAAGDEGIVEIEMNMGEMMRDSLDEEIVPANTGIFSEDA